jgi:2-dehydro-3-deoxy-D-arabinonate dehydratase
VQIMGGRVEGDMAQALWRVRTPDGPRLARGHVHSGPTELLDARLRVSAFLTDDGTLLRELDTLAAAGPVPPGTPVLPPVDEQVIWAAGVTYARSRQARQDEAVDGGDVYDRVYQAERPELFIKAMPGEAVGPGDEVGIRFDSDWDVPEPELVVAAHPSGEPRALTLGNDMSSRSIEGLNPLYLPQAKAYDRSCALGPCLVPLAAAPPLAELRIELRIERGGDAVYADTVRLGDIRRTPEELLRWLVRANTFRAGIVLLTGTSIVPPSDLTLAEGDRVTVRADGLGELVNTVRVVGRA